MCVRVCVFPPFYEYKLGVRMGFCLLLVFSFQVFLVCLTAVFFSFPKKGNSAFSTAQHIIYYPILARIPSNRSREKERSMFIVPCRHHFGSTSSSPSPLSLLLPSLLYMLLNYPSYSHSTIVKEKKMMCQTYLKNLDIYRFPTAR